MAFVALVGVAATSLASFTTPPSPHGIAGILFGIGFDDRSSLASIVRADPHARILDIRWGGRLVFVTYDDATFPVALSRAGALYMFDAVAAGCHATTQAAASPMRAASRRARLTGRERRMLALARRRSTWL